MSDNIESREFGDISTYIEDVNSMVTNIHYSGNLFAPSGPRCPRTDGGCGGRVIRLETIWLQNSDRKSPLNDLGRRAAPPRKPRMRETRPVEPVKLNSGSEPLKPVRQTSRRESIEKRESQTRSRMFREGATATAWMLTLSLLAAGIYRAVTSAPFNLCLPVLITLATIGVCALRSHSRMRPYAKEWEEVYEDETRSFQKQHETWRDDNQRNDNQFRVDTQRYHENLERFSKLERRYRNADAKFGRLLKIWEDSWSCDQCGKLWRAEKIELAEFVDQ